jgi:hypothetical protein
MENPLANIPNGNLEIENRKYIIQYFHFSSAIWIYCEMGSVPPRVFPTAFLFSMFQILCRLLPEGPFDRARQTGEGHNSEKYRIKKELKELYLQPHLRV